MPFPSDNNTSNPIVKFLRGDGIKSTDFGYYFFSPGAAREKLYTLFQGHHLIAERLNLSGLEELFDNIPNFNVNDPATNRAWLPSNDADAVRLASVGRIAPLFFVRKAWGKPGNVDS